MERFARWAAPFDAVLTPPATGEAPGLETTGDPRFCTRWTLVGAPALVLPTGRGPHGLPLGLQLVGAQGDDRRLLQTAAWVERVLTPPASTVLTGPCTPSQRSGDALVHPADVGIGRGTISNDAPHPARRPDGPRGHPPHPSRLVALARRPVRGRGRA